MMERDPRGSMVVRVYRHICDEVLHNAQTWSEWGNQTRAANVSRFCRRHCAEVLLFHCTTQHSYCCPASTPNTSRSSVCLGCWGTFFQKEEWQTIFKLCFKTSTKPQRLQNTSNPGKNHEYKQTQWSST